MAKECINCGKKIAFWDDAYRLPHVDVWFCKDCMEGPKKIIDEVKNVVTETYLETLKSELAEKLERCKVSESSKKMIQDEFRYMENEFLCGESITTMVKRFPADFEEGADAVASAGRKASGGYKEVNSYVITEGDVKVVTFVFETYYFRSGSYASLTVTLTHFQGVCTVAAIGSGGGEGLLNISWGAEGDYVKAFWKELQSENPEFELEDVTIQAIRSRYPSRKDEKEGRKSIGILGGTFDPIHNGHMALAKAAIEEGHLRKLIVMPAKVQPFKLGREITEDVHRLAMCKLAFEDMPRIEVSEYELKNTRISYTYETLSVLKRKYPESDLYFIMGTDSFLEIEGWHRGIDLLENFSFMVSVRPGYRERELDDKISYFKERYHTEVRKLTSEMPDISSTKLKVWQNQGLDISHMVPEKVERYIHEHNLYL
ncbi:MAG: nicotinate (nicotinamide) nucleotide adenylyltransferase [Firmicutes bacterium]|nr:nicotinate (nicotinamide) nucleotide adenylyltransferase [Bacillota bacterium]